jgi:hypothetical protein
MGSPAVQERTTLPLVEVFPAMPITDLEIDWEKTKGLINKIRILRYNFLIIKYLYNKYINLI